MNEGKESAPLIPPSTSDSDLSVYSLPGTEIKFQNGAMELGRNGAITEEILNVLIDHLSFFQLGKYACRENALAITKIEEAKHWILHRKQLREEQGVKGRAVAHAS